MGLDTENGCTKYGNCTRSCMSKKKDSPDHPDPKPSLEKKDVLRQAY